MAMAACLPQDPDFSVQDRADRDWILREFLFAGETRLGGRGPAVRRAQEWLVLNDYRIAVDGDFGPATRHAVTDFQFAKGLGLTGAVDAVTHDLMIQPLVRALLPIAGEGLALSELVVRYAWQHLAEAPREVGGENSGPWVRLYMRGGDGPVRPWCAGFLCYLLAQAADSLRMPVPLERTFSCDILAEQAKRRGYFVPGSYLKDADDRCRTIFPGSLFLQRRSRDKWSHAGLVVENREDCLITIEGNSGEEGGREGHEVCRRVRGYGGKDFVVYR